MKKLGKIKKSLYSIYKAAKSVSKNKWDFVAITADLLYSKLRFHATTEEYLKYRFYNLRNRYRKNFLLRYHQSISYKRVNDCWLTVDKYRFFLKLKEVFEREMILAPDCGEKAFLDFVKKHSRVVVKPYMGSCGRGIYVVNYEDDEQVLRAFRDINEKVVCEEFIHQHSALNVLNPFSLNTLRVVSVRHSEEDIEIVSATLKTSAQSASIVDNLSDSGIVAEIDIETGIVSSFGFDSSCKRYTNHPVTKTQFIGFNIPDWDKVLDLVKKAHSRLESNPVVGFDIAVTESGVDIVEGNSAPGPNIMQIMTRAPKGEKNLEILNDKKRQVYEIPKL